MVRVDVSEWIPHTPVNTRGHLIKKGQTHRSQLEDTLLTLAESWSHDHLHGLAILATVVDDLIARGVHEQRLEGASWREVGEALGISKQAAQQRYGKES